MRLLVSKENYNQNKKKGLNEAKIALNDSGYVRMYLFAASVTLSFGSTFPPNPFHRPTPNPRFFMPSKSCFPLWTWTSVRILFLTMFSVQIWANFKVLFRKLNVLVRPSSRVLCECYKYGHGTQGTQRSRQWQNKGQVTFHSLSTKSIITLLSFTIEIKFLFWNCLWYIFFWIFS